jgi:hypothetical protein
MLDKRWFLGLGLCLLTALPANAQIIRGVLCMMKAS